MGAQYSVVFRLHVFGAPVKYSNKSKATNIMAQEDVFKKIVSHCKEYGFVFPSSEIYDGLAAVYDYGQNGVELKNNIKQYWWQSMVLLHENIVGIDSAIFMHPTIWKASGHVDAFNDPLIDNRDSKKRYRADVLIEDQIAKYDEKIEKEVAKARKRFGEAFDEAQFRSTNARVLEHQAKRDALHERFKLAQAAFSSLNDRTQESLTSIRMIKAFGLEDRQSALFAADAEDTGKKNMRVARIDARFDPTIYIAIGMANLLAIGGGSWMVVQGSLTLGQLTSFMMYLGLMIWPMLALAWMFNIVERGSAAYSRIRAMLAEAPVVNDGSEPVPEGRGELDVNIRQFTYPQTDHPALENVNFALKPGQMLGICGPTGSGKSTLLSLIQRHFDVSEGNIRFHDIPLTQLQLDSWRSRLAVVSQTPFLFSDTVANNIALGCPNATQQEIEHVARLASVHDDILRLPQGYDTEVGERGVMLSGGQKQRISIARALLVNAEILILDDALSAVDGRTEHQILHNLRQWGQGRTVIISAHRLSALTEASEIIVMQHGHIAQRGNHDELAQQSGWYRDMYRYQQLEAALDDAPEIREEAVDA